MARFAVFGSWRNPADQRGNEGVQKSNHQFSHELSQEEFQRACRELGGELAEQGHQIFVASDSPSTIDFHIVQGVIGVVRKESITQPPILLVRSHARRSSKDANDCSAIHESAARSHPKLFKILSTPEDEVWKVVRDTKDWEVVHDTIAKEADKILVLGGGASTYRIAVRALADGRPIVPIGVFGGAAREVIQMLEKVGDQRNFPKYEYRRVLAHKAWGKEQLQTSLYALGVRQDPNERHKIFINYRRNDSNPIASRIFGDLCRSFSREDVFLDAETIGGGDAFEDRIMTALKQTAVFLY